MTKTDPGAGQSVPAGSTVNLYVSSGLVALPDVTGQQFDAAKSTVEALGLKVDRSEEESDEPENQVLSQQPNAGSVPQGRP